MSQQNVVIKDREKRKKTTERIYISLIFINNITKSLWAIYNSNVY